jgi:hypothetical protein
MHLFARVCAIVLPVCLLAWSPLAMGDRLVTSGFEAYPSELNEQYFATDDKAHGVPALPSVYDDAADLFLRADTANAGRGVFHWFAPLPHGIRRQHCPLAEELAGELCFPRRPRKAESPKIIVPEPVGLAGLGSSLIFIYQLWKSGWRKRRDSQDRLAVTESIACTELPAFDEVRSIAHCRSFATHHRIKARKAAIRKKYRLAA